MKTTCSLMAWLGVVGPTIASVVMTTETPVLFDLDTTSASLVASRSEPVALPYGEGANPYMETPEYQLTGTRVTRTRSRAPIASEGVELLSYEKRGTSVEAEVRSDRAGTLALPVFAFPGYEVTLAGQPAEWTRGANNRLSVSIPDGASGRLSVRWRTPALWRVFDVVSLIGLIALLACTFGPAAWRAGALRKEKKA